MKGSVRERDHRPDGPGDPERSAGIGDLVPAPDNRHRSEAGRPPRHRGGLDRPGVRRCRQPGRFHCRDGLPGGRPIGNRRDRHHAETNAPNDTPLTAQAVTLPVTLTGCGIEYDAAVGHGEDWFEVAINPEHAGRSLAVGTSGGDGFADRTSRWATRDALVDQHRRGGPAARSVFTGIPLPHRRYPRADLHRQLASSRWPGFALATATR